MRKVEKILCWIVNPKFFNSAPIAIKLAPKAMAGLPTPFIALKPFKKYFVLIINHPKTGDQHPDYLKDHPLYLQLQSDQILARNQYLRTRVPF